MQRPCVVLGEEIVVLLLFLTNFFSTVFLFCIKNVLYLHYSLCENGSGISSLS